MPVTINGTTGVIGPDGSASTPSYQGSDSNTGMFFPAADTIAFSTAGTEDMRIDSVGNVGIGTTAPDGNLQVYKNAAASVIRVTSSTTGVAGVDFGDTDAIDRGQVRYFNNGDYLLFATAATERARIDSSGALLVGTTTSTARITGYLAQTSGYAIAAVTTGTGAALYGGFSNASAVYTVFGNGNVANTNNSYGALSDVKLKENITDATPKLAQLNQVRIVNFNLIGDEQKQIGVIAQELEQIFPGMVEESPDRDEEGNELGTTTKSVKYSVFVPMLIKGMQEQQALIQSLTQRIAALEGAQA